MKKILLLLLLATFSIQAQTLQNPTYGNVKLKNNATDNSATKVNVQSTDGTINTISKSDLVNVVEVNDVPTLPLVGEVGKIYVVKNVNKIYRWNGTFYQELTTDISGKENISNKQNSLAVDGTGVKFPTVDAVNVGVFESNKKWVLFGDSISNTLLDPDYPFYVIDNLKLTGTVTNAVAGNTSADQLTILNSILTSTPTYFNSFDIASLLVGVNDWATNVPLGNRQSLITDANFAGRLKAIIEKIITAKPSIRLYVMTPFETNSVAAPYNSFNTAGYTLREMSVLISQICSDYSVQCIDLYSLSQLNLKTIPTFLSDGVHPNSIGAKFIGDIVSKAFLSNNNKGKLVDTGIKRKREDLYEEVENNIYKIQKGSFQPSTIYDVDYKVGLGKSNPSLKLEVVSTTVDPVPVLGSGTKGFVSFLSNNLLYGEYIGSSNNGDTWHQVQRNDGSTATYNMVMQPLGGNVIIGNSANTGEKLQVAGNISATLYSGGATLTGTPTAPTAPAGTNTTQIATTAFVLANAGGVTSTGTTNRIPKFTSSNSLGDSGLIQVGGNIGMGSAVVPGELFHIGDGNILLEGGGEVSQKFKRDFTTTGENLGVPTGSGISVNPIFQVGRIIQAGDGDPEIRIMYSDDNTSERTVFEVDRKGIAASVKTSIGSHFEGFASLTDVNPKFRLNSYPRMRLEMGAGGNDITDVAVERGATGSLDFFTNSAYRGGFDSSGNLNLLNTPTAPTAPAGTNTTQIATTAFVKQEINNVASIVDATSSVKGIMKLYTSTGSSIDGTMTQKATSDALSLKVDKSTQFVKSLASNFSTTSTANTNTNLSFPIGANEVWFVAIDLEITTGTSTTGMRYQISAPAGAVVEGSITGFGATSTVVVRQRFAAINTQLAALNTGGVATLENRGFIRIKNGATPGTVSLGCASNTNGTISTIWAGSTIIANKTTEV